jgi:ribonuclease HI
MAAAAPSAFLPDLATVLEIYTDGSSLANGRSGARAGFGLWFGPDDPRNVSEPVTVGVATNQNAELQALALAVQLADRDIRLGAHRQARIYTDSAYAISCVTLWVKNWRRNGWRTSSGGDVLHKEFIERTARILESCNGSIQLVKVKGHSRLAGNDGADKLARDGAARGCASGGDSSDCGVQEFRKPTKSRRRTEHKTPAPYYWDSVGGHRLEVVAEHHDE